MKVQRCKGTRDLSPQEMTAFRFIEGVFRDCCLKYGYQEIRTPTIEYLHLFTSAGTLTPGMLSRVYSFLDWDGWSGERVVLRPDGTIPVARMYIDSMENKGLAKLFYIANMFVFDDTGTRNRERWQSGAELIGARSAVADTELISLSTEVLKKLGIKGAELRLSHAGLIKSLLGRLGLGTEEQAKVFDQILDGNLEALAALKPTSPDVKKALPSLLSLKGHSAGFLRNLKSLFAESLPEVEPHLDDFIGIVDLLDSLGYKYQIDIASGAGFEYYTGLIFQFFAAGEKIGGGGRYDALIPAMSGGEIPASGFALYLDRLMSVVKPGKLDGKAARGITIRGDFSQSGALREAVGVATMLREAGYIAELELDERQTAASRWTLDVRSEAPRFALREISTGKKFETGTIEDILRLLERESARKDSSA